LSSLFLLQICQYIVIVLAIISTKMSFVNRMSTKLESPEVEVELDSQALEEEQTNKEIEQEIDCPRCHDVMALSSDFDRLLYFCQECSFSLVMK
jgi:hypothetical protein